MEMSNNSIKGIVEIQKSLHSQFDPLLKAMKPIESNLAMTQQLVRTTFGPFEEIRRDYRRLKLMLESDRKFRRMHDLMLTVGHRFYRPDITEIPKLLRKFNSIGITMKRNEEQMRRAVEAMQTPWLDIENKFRSISGFAKVQDIGHALRTMRAFDTRLTKPLRVDLGDWRQKINLPSEIFINPLARTSFYAERGLNPTLTEFPADAFDQIIASADLKIKRTSVPMVADYALEPKIEDEEEVAFKRTNAAHDLIQHLETQIRKFIDEEMKKVFGKNWTEHQVPGEIRQQWLKKRRKARDNNDCERPLIDYAAFSDYEQIITRKDNWERVFKPIFSRRTSVQESFWRLYPVRNCTMHARLITQDDELYLYAETKRILTAIRRET